MVSFKYKSQRVGNSRNKIKNYPVKNYSNINILKNETLTTQVKCNEIGELVDCSSRLRVAYCNGKVFRNPLAGYRKQSDVICTVKMQEIYKEPYTKSCGAVCHYDRRIRTMNNKNGVKNTSYNYDYNQYLRNRCRTFKQNEFRFLNSDKTYRSNCTNTDLSCNTFKMKNAKFSENSAVTSSSRITRLKHDTILEAQKNNCKNGEVCGIYTSNTRYKNKNLEPNVTKCEYRRIAGVLRKTCGR